jgi:hypothetical protein
MRKTTYYQYFTNVTHATCPDCLAWHGVISGDPATFTERGDGCERKVLPFARSELDERREMEREMKRLALDELERRRLFREGSDALGVDNERALAFFSSAAAVEVYVVELERLAEERDRILRSDAALRARLHALFSRAFSDKFGRPRYERFPEGMRYTLEKSGLARIRELFP